ncbi:hypothetical protein F3Y22_tig00000136pilonHSYRG00032 [Hibiscus syriacus]|uniref:Uncharacterized protein n=1 Tax=Hibiscus syriacus TaxID=106335 RepID=A0A6A3D6H7_HIBSY|nr:hypothetical protein F3Y22_tig00000136pilonHSYRG00032 [Hibiscus syriacus]
MDPVLMHKFRANRKSNNSEKQEFRDKFFTYTFIAFGCCTLCFFFIYDLPNLMFIAGNLIVVVLIGEHKFFASGSSFSGDTNMYYDEYVDESRRRLRNSLTRELKEEKKMKPVEEKVKKRCLGEEHELVLPSKELKKRADDFIARVNRQRMSEDRLLL